MLCVEGEGGVAGQRVRISKRKRLEADADVSSVSAAVENGLLASTCPHVEIQVHGVNEAPAADGAASSRLPLSSL